MLKLSDTFIRKCPAIRQRLLQSSSWHGRLAHETRARCPCHTCGQGVLQDPRQTIPHGCRTLLLFIAVALAHVAVAAPAATNTVASTPPQSYTNHAGHVLVGTLVSADVQRVTFRLPNGATRTLPLSIFPPAERERIGIDSGTLAPPPTVAEAFERCRLTLQRLDVLVKAGQQSEASADKRRDLERRAVRAIIADLEKEKRLTPAAAAYFTDRIPR